MKLRKILLGLLFTFLVILAGLCFYSLFYSGIYRHSGKPEGRIQNPVRQAQGKPDSGQVPTEVGIPIDIGARMTAVEYARVKQVVDGDTVKLESGETVRYIGMNSPEIYQYNEKTKKWNKVDKCYSEEALTKNKELVEGKVVRLEKDVSDKDKYDRLLRYVFACEEPSLQKRGQGEFCNQFINLELVTEGFAKKMTVLPDKKYEAQILAAEKEAKEANLGLWKACK